MRNMIPAVLSEYFPHRLDNFPFQSDSCEVTVFEISEPSELDKGSSQGDDQSVQHRWYRYFLFWGQERCQMPQNQQI